MLIYGNVAVSSLRVYSTASQKKIQQVLSSPEGNVNPDHLVLFVLTCLLKVNKFGCLTLLHF